ncbi:MAG: pyruvate dehydrogenase complex dihydrolipoamide acetyltransferase, partial [Myxococcales bacterium]|nr:pyruvate dehydrogenase complex dihydrolipoamide acetyltransferase [Myxococcales bacterium]
MAKIIGLPKLSPTMDEGTLSKWVKKEGDAVDVDDLLAEVETDKATMEFRSFDKGVLLKILAPEGESLAPDAPVAIIGQKGEDISALVASAAGGAKAPSPPVAKADVPAGGSGVSPVPSQAVGQATVPTVADHPAPAGSAPANPSSRGADGRVLASPLA